MGVGAAQTDCDLATMAVPGCQRIRLFGVPLIDATKPEAIAQFFDWIDHADGRARSVYLVNAHTMNLACERPEFRTVLSQATAVFGDGTGVRLAARMKGRRLRDNLVGTDLMPDLFAASRARGLRVFLMGGTADTVVRAGEWIEAQYPWVRVVGARDGYGAPEAEAALVDSINGSGAQVLLVAMGNPLQEEWIARHRARLRIAVCVGVGGLFDHWAGNLERAAPWIRSMGIEWMQILWQQPEKWRRYLLGNPRFVVRALRDARNP